MCLAVPVTITHYLEYLDGKGAHNHELSEIQSLSIMGQATQTTGKTKQRLILMTPMFQALPSSVASPFLS